MTVPRLPWLSGLGISGQDQREKLPPRLAFAIVLIVFFGFALIAVLNVVSADPGPLLLTFCALSSVALLGLQAVHSAPGAWRIRARYGFWTLGAQAVLTFVPLLFFKLTWGGMGGFLAGSCLLVVAAPLCWLMFAAIALGTAGTAAALGSSWIDTSYLAVSTVLTGLIVYGMTRLSNLVSELHRARQELADLAVSEERLRIARDLHDLLGFGLSAITLKSELTLRLVQQRPERAREELGAILQISRQALADVRAVASGYRAMSVNAEAASAEEVLAAAEIDARIDLDLGPVSREAGTVLAVVIREGVTNILRHSKAQHCVIEAHCVGAGNGGEGASVRITVANDGVSQDGPGSGRDGGSGLGNLRVRAAQLGGRLTAGLSDDGWYRLVVEVPRAGCTPGAQVSQPFS
ncbi:sensor histidine kinase [Streptomyces sp. BR1]|uniref:sensor histidine kinase n=1 Tax=Streptomyces sp. BR1 TaxID=1592323 RepID=UPI00402B9C3C